MKTIVVNHVLPTVLLKLPEFGLELLNFISRAELPSHEFLDFVPSQGIGGFCPASLLLSVPPRKCPFLEGTGTVTNLEILRAVAVEEGILDPLEPLQKADGAL